MALLVVVVTVTVAVAGKVVAVAGDTVQDGPCGTTAQVKLTDEIVAEAVTVIGAETESPAVTPSDGVVVETWTDSKNAGFICCVIAALVLVAKLESPE
jgi:hypothetical protein